MNIIKELNQATGPDKALDARISALLFFPADLPELEAGWEYRLEPDQDGFVTVYAIQSFEVKELRRYAPLPYTRSFDAASSLFNDKQTAIKKLRNASSDTSDQWEVIKRLIIAALNERGIE